MHNTRIQTVPNAVPGRDSITIEVLGMKGIPDSYYAALDSDRTKRPRQYPAPVEPPLYSATPPFAPSPHAIHPTQHAPHLPAPYSSAPVSPYRIPSLRQPGPNPSLPTYAYFPSVSQPHGPRPYALSAYPSTAPRTGLADSRPYHAYTTPPLGSSGVGICPTTPTQAPSMPMPSAPIPIKSSSYIAPGPACPPGRYTAVSEPGAAPYAYPSPQTSLPIQVSAEKLVPQTNRSPYLPVRPVEASMGFGRYEQRPLGQPPIPQHPPPVVTLDRVLFESRHMSPEEQRALLPRYRTELRQNLKQA